MHTQEGSPGYTPFRGTGGQWVLPRPGVVCARRETPPPGDKASPQRQEAGQGGEGRRGRGASWGSSYLSTGRCRRVSARVPRRRLGRSTRARCRRPGSCSCCGPRRLLEGTGPSARGPPAAPRSPPPPAPPASPGPTCRDGGAGAAPHRQPVEARGAAGGHSPAAAVGRAVAAEALCGETRPGHAGGPGSPGRSPAHPPPVRGRSPPPSPGDRPLSPATKPGRAPRHSPSAAASSSQPSSRAPSAAARRGPPCSILGAVGEEPPPARPRRSAPRRDLRRFSPPR